MAHLCGQETARFYNRQAHDPRYCAELFRRAAVERDQGAWAIVYAQYQPLVTGWVQRHPAYPAAGEEAAYFVNRAFEKLWSAMTPQKFARFPDLKSILRYLQMCVNSAIVDHARAAELAELELAAGVGAAPGHGGAQTREMESQAIAQDLQGGLWGYLDERLKDERERVVLHGCYVLDLRPRQLCDQYPRLFHDVGEVYRVKQNILARLRRDPEIRHFLPVDA